MNDLPGSTTGATAGALSVSARQASWQGARGAPSLGRRILALVAVVALSLLAIGAFGVWRAHEAARQQAAAGVLNTARALARAVDFEMSRAEALLQGLALSPALRRGAFEEFFADARAVAESVGLGTMSVARPDGTLPASSSMAVPAPTQRAAPDMLEVFETGRTAVSDFEWAALTGQRSVLLSVPVRATPGEGEIRTVLSAVLPRAALTAALVDQRLPEGWVAAVLDRRHTVVARSRREEAVLGQPATAPVRAGLDAGDEGLIFDIVNQDGERSVVGYARAPRFGYAVVVATPEAVFREARNAALLGLGVLALPVAVLALLVGAALNLRLTHALGGLAAGVAGRPRLREVQELAAALGTERAARDAVENALRDRTAWFEAAQQAARVGVWQNDLRAGRSRWSVGMSSILGLPVAPGVVETPAPQGRWIEHVHPEDRPRILAAARAQLAKGAPPFCEEFRVLTADGAVRLVRSQGAVERDSSGQVLRILGAWIDITERRALEDAREAAMRQRDLLAGEIHHRIRNSLQLVLSLLLLQARRAAPEAATALRGAATRVATIARVHRRLYEAGPEGAGDLGSYLGALAGDLQDSLGGAERGRALELALAPGIAPAPDRLPAIGIIVTELVTNAHKYGAGHVRLSLARRDGTIEIAVQDDGPGFPADFDPAQSRGLGMRVAMTLARQLGGTLAVDRGAPGARVVLSFPEAG